MLDVIQEQLESIYGLRCEYRAKDFVIDGHAAKTLGGTARAREELLVAEGEEGLELSLYLEPTLLARLSTLHPVEAMASDLSAFCEVAEGVSHFLYVARSAALERKVSLLEMEAQAEVDKFALCTVLRWGSDVAHWATDLVDRLFQSVSFHAHLGLEERRRYETANRLGLRYARRLLPLIRRGSLDRVLAELRHSYRMGAEAKLHYLDR
ncbi:MAG: hypothetical protein AB1938_01955 [Myxococcota bacterium]